MHKLLYGFMTLCVILLLYLPFLPQQQLSYAQLEQSVEANLTIPFPLQKETMLKKNFQLQDIPYESFLYYMNEDAMDVDEIVIIKTASQYHNDVIKALQKRIDSQKQKFQGYGEIQIQKLNQAKIIQCADCVILIISDDAQLLSLGGVL